MILRNLPGGPNNIALYKGGELAKVFRVSGFGGNKNALLATCFANCGSRSRGKSSFFSVVTSPASSRSASISWDHSLVLSEIKNKRLLGGNKSI